MEQRSRADPRGVALQLRTAGELGVFELLNRGEVPIDQDRIGRRLRVQEVRNRLQLGRVGRQKQQVHGFGHAQAQTCVPSLPASPIQDEHDLLGGTRAGLASKYSQLCCEEGDADTARQMEERAPEAGWTKPTR